VSDSAELFTDCANQKHDGKRHSLMLIGLNNRDVDLFSFKMFDFKTLISCFMCSYKLCVDVPKLADSAIYDVIFIIIIFK